jgi:sulfatase-like protein
VSTSETSGDSTPESLHHTSLRREGMAFVELFALCGIAVAQPLLDILSKNTGLFVTRSTTALQAVALTFLVVIVPPLACWAVEAIVGAIAPRARPYVHAALAAVLVAVIALEVVKKQTSLGPTALLVIAAVLGVIGGVLVFAARPVRQFLRYLAIAPLIFALLFLGASPVTDVVFSSHPASAATVGISTPKRIVLVVFDEFPEESLLDGSGHVDSQLFPNFAAFARASTWYRNETTVAPYTELAVPAILTGQYPPRADALPSTLDYPKNLFTLLGKAYDMNVHEAVTRLCPDRLCGTSRGSGFGGLVSQSAQLWKQFASPHRTQFSFNESAGTVLALQTAKDFVASLKPASRPRLDFVHIELPHQPWHYLPTLQDTEATGAMPGEQYLSWSDPSSAATARQRHLLQVQASDTLLGNIIAKLKRVGAYDNSLIVVTADHGVAFTNQEPLRSVSNKNYPQIMWPPLMVKYPGQQTGRIDDRPALSIDIMPTIADVIGAKVPWHVDGRSLRATPRAEGPRRMYQWGAHALEPPSALKPPPGRLYLEFDGAKGFAEVLRTRSVPAGPDPALRIYQARDYGRLVGRPVAPLVRDQASPAFAAIMSAGRLDEVQPNAARVPWAYNEAFFNKLDGPHPVAIAVNGRVAAVSDAVTLDKKGSAFFTFVLPPSLMQRGRNDPQLFLIRGTPESPTLDPVPLRR